MALEKIIKIPTGKDEYSEIRFKASANVPRMYRIWFGRDVIKDMTSLKDAAKRVTDDENDEVFSNMELTIFENVAYTMARLGSDDIRNFLGVDDWFEQFTVFSIYEILPELLELWNLNMETSSESKKKLAKLTEK